MSDSSFGKEMIHEEAPIYENIKRYRTKEEETLLEN